MGHIRRLIESRPMLSRIPDQSLIVEEKSEGEHIRATRGNRYVFVYLPMGGRVTVSLRSFANRPMRASWFNPRNGETGGAFLLATADQLSFKAPSSGRGKDWVLVLDDLSKRDPLEE